MEIILASGNKGKLKELGELVNPMGIDVRSMQEIGFEEDVAETGSTLKENAYIKAKAIFDYCGKTTLSDDSGLFVDALNGDPGVISARYAGVDKNNEDNINLLLENLKDVEDRSAHFACTLCLINLNGEATYFEGKVHGRIIKHKIGTEGFGYDPIFIPNGYDETFAQLSSAIKNKISHRAKAMEIFENFIGGNILN